MRKLLSVIVSLMTAMTFAQQPVELPLWPDGAPNSNGLTGGEKEVSPHRIPEVATAASPWIMKDTIWHPGSADRASLTLY